MNLSVADTHQVRLDVLSGRFSRGIGQPALTEPDENACVAACARQ